MTPYRLLLFILLGSLTACLGQVDMEASPKWITASPTLSSEGLAVVGVSYPSPDERSARESALHGALTEFLRYTGMEVNSYARVVSRETVPGFGTPRLWTDTTDQATIATRGFVQRVRQMAWHLVRDPSGGHIAYALILVPADEVRRAEQEVQEAREARTAPYRKAREAFLAAVREHQLPLAAQMIPELVELGADLNGLGSLKLTKEQLGREVLEGVKLELCEPALFDLDRDSKATLTVCVSHRGAAVPHFPLAIRIPSGLTVETVTGEDGRSVAHLPSPSYAGLYPVVAQVGLKEIALSQTFRFQVVGRNESLSSGQFHDFIEVRATGTALPNRFSTHAQGEQIALQTARHLAYARLLEMRDGVAIASRNVLNGPQMAENVTTSLAAGRVAGKVVKETVRWQEQRPVAEVILRVPLH